jgi:hypothetical protein
VKRSILLTGYTAPATGVAVLLTSLLLPLQAKAVPVLDPSFETPASHGLLYTPAGGDWIFSYPSGIASGTFFSGPAPDGNQAAFIQTGSSVAGTISQSLSGFTVGQSYTTTFWIAERPGYSADPVTVTLGGIALGTYTPSSSSFTEVTTSALVAEATDMTLMFAGAVSGGDIGSAIDLVSVNDAADSVPEPASGLVLLAGAVVLGTVRLLRGRAVPFMAGQTPSMVEV